jgi:hypothetical protein
MLLFVDTPAPVKHKMRLACATSAFTRFMASSLT